MLLALKKIILRNFHLSNASVFFLCFHRASLEDMRRAAQAQQQTSNTKTSTGSNLVNNAAPIAHSNPPPFVNTV